MNVAFTTLGCKVNQYDTQSMAELFKQAGHAIVAFEEIADAYIINTCTVTQVSDKKSRQLIARAHAKNPDAIIAAVGCYAQRSADELLALSGVSLVLGTKERTSIVTLVENAKHTGQANAVRTLGENEGFEELVIHTGERTRANIKIQEGCNNRCAYCIIPYVRGSARSRPVEDIRAQAQLLSDAGYGELVITGINLASYKSGDSTLSCAIAAVCAPDGVKRVRLGSIEPETLTDEFIAFAVKEQKLCRHYHVSLQSGSTTVLERMQRGYTPQEYLSSLQKLRRAIPDAAITTDVIVGFPGETAEEFAETLAFVERAAFSKLHVFPYSRRKGTAAFDMPGQIPSSEKSERARKLGELAKRLESKYAQKFVGKNVQVLFETHENGVLYGRTDTYLYVSARGEDSLRGSFANVHITREHSGTLSGEIQKD